VLDLFEDLFIAVPLLTLLLIIISQDIVAVVRVLAFMNQGFQNKMYISFNHWCFYLYIVSLVYYYFWNFSNRLS